MFKLNNQLEKNIRLIFGAKNCQFLQDCIKHWRVLKTQTSLNPILMNIFFTIKDDSGPLIVKWHWKQINHCKVEEY